MKELKIRLFVFAVLMALVAVATVSLPAVQPNSAAAILLADGSDPMPLCRPGQNGCPTKPPQMFKRTSPQDGGPIPVCAPGDKECLKNWPF